MIKLARVYRFLYRNSKIKIASKKSKGNLFVQYYKDTIKHPDMHIRLSFRFQNNSSCVFSIKKFELHGFQVLLTGRMSNLTIAKTPPLQEPIIRYKQMWNNWEQLRCVALSPLIVCMTIALVNVLAMFTVRTSCVLEKSSFTDRFFNFSAEATIIILKAQLPVRFASFPLKNKRIHFSRGLSKGFLFWKIHKNQF